MINSYLYIISMQYSNMKKGSNSKKPENEFLALYKTNRFHASKDDAKNCIEDAMLDYIEKYSKLKSTDELA